MVAAVMLVRDEADIIGFNVEYLLGQVDHVYVLNNRSSDETGEILEECDGVTVTYDEEIGYHQADKTSWLGRQALEDGHDWVIPVDADERWHAPEGTLKEYLSGVPLDVQVVRAKLLNFVSTGEDPDVPSPFDRINWRLPAVGQMGKVAARAHKKLYIHMGNHSVDYGSMPFLAADGLWIRHYPWRSEEQYVRKIRNGIEACVAAGLPFETCQHWRMFEPHTDEEIAAHFRTWFYEETPPGRHELFYDPLVSDPRSMNPESLMVKEGQ